MNKKEKFENFLESLKGNEQDNLIETIKSGFQTCYEAESENSVIRSGKEEQEIIKGYVTAMLWTEEDNIGGDKDINDFALETIEQIKGDISNFYDVSYKLLNETPDDYSLEQAGHDFWLTRNGHGVGFWDRDLDEIGDKLTAISKKFGESDLYVGDDGKLYIT